jgi:AraC-like DNA-binding protein
VHCVWELDGDGSVLSEPIFPDGRVEIVIHLGDRPARDLDGRPQPAAMIVGQMTTALRLRPVRRLHSIGVRFTPAGSRAALRIPLHELSGRIEPLDALSAALTARLQDAVGDARTAGDRAALVFACLRIFMQGSVGAPDRVERAVALALSRHGRCTVDGMARTAGTSARQLERQFLDAVGLPPKTFARIVRFQHALRDLQRGLPAASVAAARGFADQSHLAREFKRVAGVPAGHVDLRRVAFVQDDAGRPRGD